MRAGSGEAHMCCEKVSVVNGDVPVSPADKADPTAVPYRRLRLPEFLDSRHVNVARSVSLSTDRLYPPGYTPGTLFY